MSPARRGADLDAVAGSAVDVVVVGGGVTGAGVARDAVTRGLSVALLERTDLVAGTSRWSSELVHGGLRYLARGEVGLARESARERAVLMGATAPHLVRPLAFLVPDVAGRDVTALARLGGRLGDAVRISVPGGRRSLPGTRRVGADEVARLVPGVRGRRGGVVFWDGQLADDVRLVVALARTAAASGARVLTGAAVQAVDGADVHVETDDGEAMTLRAGVVVNATGVWAQRLAPDVRLVPSRGSHLVVPAERLGSPTAALTGEPVAGPVPDASHLPGDVFRSVRRGWRVEAVDTYTHGHADAVLQSHRWRTAENSASHLLPHLRPGLDLLDVGCGPGTITVDLARRVAPGRVVGLDVSSDPLAEARELAAREDVAVTFAVGDAYALEAADDSFDVVHAHQVLQHLADPVAALREMARVCRPGGVIAVRDVDYAATTWFPADEGLDRWLDLYHRVARRNGAEPDAGRRLLSWARAAGLRSATATASTYCFASPADRQWWGSSWAGRATSSAFAEQAVAYGLATPGDLDEIAAAWLRWAAADDGWLGMLHGELLVRV